MTQTTWGTMFGTLLGLVCAALLTIGFAVGRTTAAAPECPAAASGSPTRPDQPSADVVVPHEAPRAHKRT